MICLGQSEGLTLSELVTADQSEASILVWLPLMYGDNTRTCLWAQTGNTNQLLVLSPHSGNYSADVQQGQSETSI